MGVDKEKLESERATILESTWSLDIGINLPFFSQLSSNMLYEMETIILGVS